HDSDINSIIVKLDKSLDQCCKSHNEIAIYNNIIEEEQAKYYNDLVSLYHALQNNMFTLVYQPKIDIQNDKIAGVEALLRWNDSKHKNMSISELIKKAEAAGFINQITKWVIKNVAEQLKIWNQKGINTAVSINLSSRDLADESFVNYVKNCITINEINPECIEFELTERSIIQDEKIAMEEIRKLKDMGIKISIDDYGTGFNSIKYLLEFGGVFDYLKIDKIFIDRISNQENLIIVDCIIKAAQRLAMKVIAEGAETKEQADILKSANCDMIQGYYYSKPLMPDELEKFILKY
ncbi:MAG: EAL domain-containing protein, partial [Sedimentibacter sp.]